MVPFFGGKTGVEVGAGIGGGKAGEYGRVGVSDWLGGSTNDACGDCCVINGGSGGAEGA